MVLQCINGVGSNPVEGRTKFDSFDIYDWVVDSCLFNTSMGGNFKL
jgi:hypothetical protein